MEDLDPPREEPGAAGRILDSLAVHGLHADEPVMWQGDRGPAYQEALAQLEQAGHLFHCDCTRAMLGPGGACRGRCLPRQSDISGPASIRVRVPRDCRIEFTDRIQGHFEVALGEVLPDFVVRRKDGLIAYQLAVVVDDAAQRINEVVRGSDLLDSTARQIFLQGILNLSTPGYCHVPVITNDLGQKFSKQNHAPALDDSAAAANLRDALRFLRQAEPPDALEDPAALLAFAAARWSYEAVPGIMGIPA
jgi:glutamyl-Q tRNA(Asp) synthetase